MVLLLNLDTLGTIRDVQLIESAQLAISRNTQGCMADGYLHGDAVVLRTSRRLSSTHWRGRFHYAVLTQVASRVNAMITPVTIARTKCNTLTHEAGGVVRKEKPLTEGRRRLPGICSPRRITPHLFSQHCPRYNFLHEKDLLSITSRRILADLATFRGVRWWAYVWYSRTVRH